MTIGTPVKVLEDGTVNHNNNTVSSATTGDAPAGSLIVVSISAPGTPGVTHITALTDSAGNTYALATSSFSNFDIELWYKLNAIHLPIGGTFTATTSAAGQYSINAAGAVAGANGGFDASGVNHVTSTTMTVTTSSTVVQYSIAFAAINGMGVSGTYTEDSNWTGLIADPAVNNPLAYRKLSSKGTTAWTPAWTPSTAVDGAVATFKMTPDFGWHHQGAVDISGQLRRGSGGSPR
jgi:hypothetical protein